MISIALIDENRIHRECAVTILAADGRFSPVSIATPDELAALDELAPAVVIVDMALQDTAPLPLVQRIARDLPDSRVVVMNLAGVEPNLVDFIAAGVSGFILREASIQEFLTTISAVAHSEAVLPPELATRLMRDLNSGPRENRVADAIVPAQLTRRESEMLELISDGLSNKEIASRLGIARHTVKSHVRNLMEKLGVHTRLQVAALAHRTAKQ
jgi:two-component system nitrate/nitrite response regulator NarL